MEIKLNHREMNSLQMLTRYKAWMLDVMFRAVAEIPAPELTKVRPTTFKTIPHTFNHIHVVDDIFRAHLGGRDHGYDARNTETTPDLPDLRKACEEMNQWYIAFADGQSDADLAAVIAFEFVGGGAGSMSRAEMLHHVVNHATYHVGYVSNMMYQIPDEPPATDLSVYLRDVGGM